MMVLALSAPPPCTQRRRSATIINDARDDAGGYRRGGERSRRPSKTSGGRKNSSKGAGFEQKTRRRGRPAWQRSPDDTPLRDGNRDRLMGLLTERAAKTLSWYLMELNPTLHMWLTIYIERNPIPRDGSWDDVSGETFLRKLLSMPIEASKFDIGRPDMYDCAGTIGVNPREIATRIMSIRSQIAKEFVQELKQVSEENSALMRETLVNSFSLTTTLEVEPGVVGDGGTHPEMVHPDFTDNSAIGADD